MEEHQKRINRIVAIGVFLIAFATYLKTMAPTVSFWDCGEFIATSYILGIPHPPGAPLYILLGRIFTLLPLPGDIAAHVNLLSPIASAAAVLLLYLVTVRLIELCRGRSRSLPQTLGICAGGAVAALSLAFSDTFWFNAVEAEVYGFSMALTMLAIWLSLLWFERREQPGSSKLLLFIAYLFGLGGGVHLLCWLTAPAILLIILLADPKVLKDPKLWIVAVALFFVLVTLASGASPLWPLIALAISAGFILYARPGLFKFGAAGLFLFILGYSTYYMLMVRSGLNPAIDENNPETWHRLLEFLQRKQYGQESMLATIFQRRAPLMGYQLPMFIKYFFQQFPLSIAKISATFYRITEGHEPVIIHIPFIPLALGVGGIYLHLRSDPRRFWPFLLAFLLMGFGLVIYLNMDDPQPRERDYVFVGAFAFFAIWIGMGAFWVIDYLRSKLHRPLSVGLVSIVFLLMPLNFFARNYHSHDRTGNYIAYDYGYNILQTCERDAILFTNGDNDTFPLWFLQEVEGIRKDVRVVNLSLLKTPWYIKQLRDFSPKVPIGLSDSSIERIASRLLPWPEPKEMSVAGLVWNMPNTGEIMYGGERVKILETHARMIVRIIQQNNWKRPIYFAITVSEENKIGLNPYLRMEGMAYRLVRTKGENQIDIERTRRNLLEVYRYRGLNDPKVYKDLNQERLLVNYRSAFLRLAEAYLKKGEKEAAYQTIERLEDTFSLNWDEYCFIADRSFRAGKVEEGRRYIERAVSLAEQQGPQAMLSAAYLIERLGETRQAVYLYRKVKEKVLESGRNDAKAPQILDFLKARLKALGADTLSATPEGR
ncbi:MAG TPA: DUF2723 domain-containing protein [Candidatus Latescibacteria bacterium]|nr:DUF2723 domain-containing protein [Candidatus Latescibacterota bacterium]